MALLDNGLIDYINSLDINQLRTCQTLINQVIVSKLSPGNPDKSVSSDHNTSFRRDINDYVDYHSDFIDTKEKNALDEEVKSFNFNTQPDSDVIQNRFISSFVEPYTWDSSKGPVVNGALSIEDYPIIKSMMEKINNDFGYQLNCALISYYHNGTVNARKHTDDEASISQTDPICVLSIGANRRVEFYDKINDSYNANPIMKLAPKDSSLYIMKQGCQKYFKHRVPMDRRVKRSRICVSFRRFIPESERTVTLLSPSVSTPLPVLQVHLTKPAPIPFSEDSSPVSTSETRGESSNIPNKLYVACPGNSSVGIEHRPAPPPADHDGYAPFSEFNSTARTFMTGRSSKPTSDEKLCLILGTSITSGVDAKKMSRGSRTVVNCSYSGARIQDIKKVAEDFYIENAPSVNLVDKIILSLGTNEVKWFNSDKYDICKRYRAPLIDLIKSLKYMFPHAIIIFQSVLPIRLYYKYTAKSVNQFNGLLFDICRNYGCMFLDCFNDFLDQFHFDHDASLFRDSCHLNDFGLSRLCQAFKYIIYRSSFNPLLRYQRFTSSYNFR